MSNSFLIFAAILFASFLGLSFLQLTKTFDPEHHGAHHGDLVNGFPIPEMAVASTDEVFITPISVRLADANAALGPRERCEVHYLPRFRTGRR